MTLPSPPRGARNLLPGEVGTKVIGGRPYHWSRELGVDFLKATHTETLVLVHGRDPEEPVPCGKVLLRSDDRVTAVEAARCRRRKGHDGDHRDDLRGLRWADGS